MTVLLLLPLLSACGTVTINDFQACSAIPGGAYGAACDNFLKSNQEILSESQWQALQASWFAAGEVSECMRSGALADLKAEVEKLCSEATCSDDESSAAATTVAGLNRMIAVAARSKSLAHHKGELK